jgi:phospholipid/cholesterol/gamma-HCH transport system ATP-binding protein
MTYIKTYNLYKSFGDNRVLSGVNLELQKGQSLVIIGRSGTGKSILIKTLIGIIRPDSGFATVKGVDFVKASLKEKQHVLSSCGFLFQGGALFDSLNIEENITFSISKNTNLKKRQKRDLAASKLHEVGLEDRLLDLYPAELSGGMMKRVALARAICANPEIIIFDEPTTGLDPIMSNIINDLIIKVRTNLNATTITITHDINSLRQIATQVLMIEKGKVVWQGLKDEIDTTNNQYIKQFINGNIAGPINFN